jgi:hypothetical protein
MSLDVYVISRSYSAAGHSIARQIPLFPPARSFLSDMVTQGRADNSSHMLMRKNKLSATACSDMFLPIMVAQGENQNTNNHNTTSPGNVCPLQAHLATSPLPTSKDTNPRDFYTSQKLHPTAIGLVVRAFYFRERSPTHYLTVVQQCVAPVRDGTGSIHGKQHKIRNSERKRREERGDG